MNFVPCSSRHKSCSRYHADLVRGYIEERERQETVNEIPLSSFSSTGDHGGEYLSWIADGNSIVTFKEWLMANKRTDK